MSLRPICAQCRIFYRPKKNGFDFVEAILNNAEEWEPYKLWEGDLWECKGCGSEIIVGVGNKPISQRGEPDFKEKLVSFDPKLTVHG